MRRGSFSQFLHVRSQCSLMGLSLLLFIFPFYRFEYRSRRIDAIAYLLFLKSLKFFLKINQSGWLIFG